LVNSKILCNSRLKFRVTDIRRKILIFCTFVCAPHRVSSLWPRKYPDSHSIFSGLNRYKTLPSRSLTALHGLLTFLSLTFSTLTMIKNFHF
jgi:hypothetical protein